MPRRVRRLEAHVIAHALDNPRDERHAVELRHLARHRDIRIHQRVVVADHVLSGVGGGARRPALVKSFPFY